MTDDIDFINLKAGRKLDELVAIRVMGFEALTIGYPGTEYESPRQKELTRWLRKVGLESVGSYFLDVKHNAWTPVEDFRPTRDIATAWHVFERVRWTFVPTSDGWNAFAVDLGLHPCLDPWLTLDRLHRLSPFAISRAALRAVVSSTAPIPSAAAPVSPSCPM